MNIKLAFALLTVATTLIASESKIRSATSYSDSEDTVITLRRTGCSGQGPCAIFDVAIYGDGEVIYFGHDYVNVKGEQRSRISKAAVDSLVEKFAKEQFFQFAGSNTCAEPQSDSEMVCVSLRLGDQFGESGDVNVVYNLIRMIKTTANTEQWTGFLERYKRYDDSVRNVREVERLRLDSLFEAGLSPSIVGDTLITLERTMCYGTCPNYEVALDGRGNVYYLGKSSVETEGIQTDSISIDSVATLLAEFKGIGFFSLKEKYPAPNERGITIEVTDVPSRITTLTIGDLTKQVRNKSGGPPELAELEKRIDKVANTEQWTGVEERHRKYDSLRVEREKAKEQKNK